MPIRLDQIEVGKTYRFLGYGGRELKPRTVTAYDSHIRLSGGRVSSHTGITQCGRQSQRECMAGTYFAEHAELIDSSLPQEKKP